MKALLSILVVLFQISAFAADFKVIPNTSQVILNKDFSAGGKVSGGSLFWKKGGSYTISIKKALIGEDNRDTYREFRKHHIVNFSFKPNGGAPGFTCSGVTALLTEDAFGDKYKYSMDIKYFDGKRKKGCPYFTTIFFEKMNQNSKKVKVKVLISPTNDLEEDEYVGTFSIL